MEDAPNPFDADPVTPEARISDGLGRIATAIRAHDWAGASAAGLTPTQGRLLALLADEPEGLRLGQLAKSLSISPPTVSDAIGTMERKGLVARKADPADGRAVRFLLSDEGRVAAVGAAAWPSFLQDAVRHLGVEQQATLNRLLVELIRSMQESGDIASQRMCVSCHWFRPNVHVGDAQRPHHCAYVDASFGDLRIRLDCREHETAAADELAALWLRFTEGLMGRDMPGTIRT